MKRPCARAAANAVFSFGSEARQRGRIALLQGPLVAVSAPLKSSSSSASLLGSTVTGLSCGGGGTLTFAQSSMIVSARAPPSVARQAASSRNRRKCSSSALLAGDAGLGEGRHAIVTGNRRLDEADRQRRARALAEPHAEVQQRRLIDLAQSPRVSVLGRDVAGQAMVEGARVQCMQHRGGGTDDEAVEQHRHALM